LHSLTRSVKQLFLHFLLISTLILTCFSFLLGNTTEFSALLVFWTLN
jgi:hypothetical protein